MLYIFQKVAEFVIIIKSQIVALFLNVELEIYKLFTYIVYSRWPPHNVENLKNMENVFYINNARFDIDLYKRR